MICDLYDARWDGNESRVLRKYTAFPRNRVNIRRWLTVKLKAFQGSDSLDFRRYFPMIMKIVNDAS